MQNKCFKLSTSQWVWGRSGNWRLYYSIKKYGRQFVTALVSGEKHSDVDASSTYSRQIIISGATAASSTKSRRSRKSWGTSERFCFRRSSSNSTLNAAIPLNNEDANEVVWSNEKTIDINNGVIRQCQTNQLASNTPNEDQLSVTESSLGDGVLFTVIDGHGGHLFGEDVKVRLPYYLHTVLSDNLNNKDEILLSSVVNDLLQNNKDIIDVNEPWMKSLSEFLAENQQQEQPKILSEYLSSSIQHIMGVPDANDPSKPMRIRNAICRAFVRLDTDMISELMNLSNSSGGLDRQNVGSALSGCCALAAYIDKDELFIANAGDCRAVLGSKVKGEWSAVQLTNDHTAASNPEEVHRILSEHPAEEARTCIQYGRLLSRLAPLRALGDLQFKLPNEELIKMFKNIPRYTPMGHSRTPPYLTAEPEFFHYKLDASDRFIVLASDGLWDMLSNDDVVELVAAYLEGRQVDILKEKAFLYGVPNYEDLISTEDAFADTRNENAASFLIRFALGGYDPQNFTSMLSIPHPDVRMYRDDITITVIFLNSEQDQDQDQEQLF